MKDKGKHSGPHPYGARMYEYVSEDGTVYWSFTRHSKKVTPNLRLKLKSYQGEFVLTFSYRVKSLASMVLELFSEGEQ